MIPCLLFIQMGILLDLVSLFSDYKTEPGIFPSYQTTVLSWPRVLTIQAKT